MIAAVVVAALLVGAGVGLALNMRHGNQRTTQSNTTGSASQVALPPAASQGQASLNGFSPASTSALDSPSETVAPTPSPTYPTTSAGGIDLTAVQKDPRTPAIASTLDTYFGGINSHTAYEALSAFDPSGQINHNDPAQVANFQRNTSSSHDDQITVKEILSDPASPSDSLVVVTFRSTQKPQYGPDGESCTNWMLTYEMTQAFKILRSTSADHASC